MVKPRRLDERGSLHLPLAAVLVLFVVSGFGTWGFLRHWRHRVETQLALDRCVGKTAIELREILNSLEGANRKIQLLRTLLAPAAIVPQTRSAHQAALEALVIWQEGRMLQWRLKQGRWITGLGCSGSAGLRTPLPSLPWVRDPPDPIGPQALRWPLGVEREFFFQLNRSPRHAAARVTFGETKNDESRWSASWANPF